MPPKNGQGTKPKQPEVKKGGDAKPIAKGRSGDTKPIAKGAGADFGKKKEGKPAGDSGKPHDYDF